MLNIRCFCFLLKQLFLFYCIRRKSGGFNILGLCCCKNKESHSSKTVLNCIWTEMYINFHLYERVKSMYCLEKGTKWLLHLELDGKLFYCSVWDATAGLCYGVKRQPQWHCNFPSGNKLVFVDHITLNEICSLWCLLVGHLLHALFWIVIHISVWHCFFKRLKTS